VVIIIQHICISDHQTVHLIYNFCCQTYLNFLIYLQFFKYASQTLLPLCTSYMALEYFFSNSVSKEGRAGCHGSCFNPSHSGGRDQKDDHMRAAWAKTQDPIWKINKAKRAGNLADTVEHLPSKYSPWVQTLAPPKINLKSRSIMIIFTL
jgi:hypothetical protein